MIGAKLFVCNVIVCLVTSSSGLSIRAEEERRQSSPGTDLNETQALNVIPGIKFYVPADGEIIVRVRIRDLLQEKKTEVQARKEKKNPLRRLGFMLTMAPFVMQVLSLPGAIASIKMSLLKSIMVAQLAIAIMIYNLIRSIQNHNAEVVVYRHSQHHAHYHHAHQQGDDEDDWFGRR